MKPEIFNSFMIGIAVGYSIRHFFPPKEIHARERWMAGILWLIVIIVLIGRFSNKKSNGKKSE